MHLSPPKPLDRPQQQALNYFFIDAVNPRDCCAAAGIDAQSFDEACSPFARSLRGHNVPYNRMLTAKNPVDADPLRLDYEMRLCRLQAQHQRCIENFRRTDDYSSQVLKNHLSQPGARPLSNKAISGDIRFLQLARQIRQEMDQLEARLQDHIEQLAARYHAAPSELSPPTPPPDTPPSSPPVNEPATASSQVKPAPQTTLDKAVTENSPKPQVKPQPLTPPQRLAAATRPDALLTREELLLALSPKNTPALDPPMRTALSQQFRR
jgi:hypothetical protein